MKQQFHSGHAEMLEAAFQLASSLSRRAKDETYWSKQADKAWADYYKLQDEIEQMMMSKSD